MSRDCTAELVLRNQCSHFVFSASQLLNDKVKILTEVPPWDIFPWEDESGIAFKIAVVCAKRKLRVFLHSACTAQKHSMAARC